MPNVLQIRPPATGRSSLAADHDEATRRIPERTPVFTTLGYRLLDTLFSCRPNA